jgi:hypothetical protein
VSYQALTQPSGIGRVLDSGFKLFVASLKPVFVLVVAVSITSILMEYSMFQLMLPAQQFTTQEEVTQYMAEVLPQFLGISVFMTLIMYIFYNAVIYRIGNVAKGTEDDLFESLIVGIKKAIPVFIALILYSLIVGLGMMLLIIPGLILMLTLLFYQILIVNDNEGVFSSLRTSHRLVWGNYWRTAAVITVPMFIMIVFLTIPGIIQGYSEAMNQAEMVRQGEMATAYQQSYGVTDIVSSLLSSMAMALLAAICIVHLNDLKLRKSGSDLEQRMDG